MLVVLVLLAAYLPLGFLAPFVGIHYAWELLEERKSVVHLVWGAWLIVATLVGNLQILACLACPHRNSIWLQNPYLKTTASFGQLSWVFLGIDFYPWFPWVIGSAVLFTITPASFHWPGATETWTQDWRQHRLLQRPPLLPSPSPENESVSNKAASDGVNDPS